MHKFPDIPIVEIGPGSQPQTEDDALEYMPMPSSMHTYQPPRLPEPEDCANTDAGQQLLERVLSALRAFKPGEDARSFDLAGLSAESLDFVNQALGEGEVSVSFDGASPIKAQESVLAGVWRVQHFDSHGTVIHDTIEVGEVPYMVRHFAFPETGGPNLDLRFDDKDPTLQNAPAVLVELADKLTGYRQGDPAHAVNLTLLPLTEGDVLLLGERMGVGPITILSRGYGNCRIGSTAQRNGWWIKYFNSQDALILNTIEVVDVPSVALAAAEDIADSALRLDEILALYRDDPR
jgi:hydrogenase-1 operon protein HyaF